MEAYSGGENGYAIGFIAGGLFNRTNSLVVRVNYDEARHKEIATNVAGATLRFFREGLDSGYGVAAISDLNGHTPEQARALRAKSWAGEFLPVWQKWVGRLAAMIEDPSFRSEDEYSVIHETSKRVRAIALPSKAVTYVAASTNDLSSPRHSNGFAAVAY